MRVNVYDWLTRIVLEKSCKTVVVNVVNFFVQISTAYTDGMK